MQITTCLCLKLFKCLIDLRINNKLFDVTQKPYTILDLADLCSITLSYLHFTPASLTTLTCFQSLKLSKTPHTTGPFHMLFLCLEWPSLSCFAWFVPSGINHHFLGKPCLTFLTFSNSYIMCSYIALYLSFHVLIIMGTFLQFIFTFFRKLIY